MDIYLIRHTPTAMPKGLCYGQSDVALADSFAQDLASLWQKLPTRLSDCCVFSSPLSRCALLAERLSQQVCFDDNLQELNFGAWENQYFDAIDADLLLNWTADFVTIAPPGGESFNDLCDRVDCFWQKLISIDAPQAFVITHAGVIRAILAKILQLPPANAFQFRIDYGSIHKLQHSAHYTHIHFLNL